MDEQQPQEQPSEPVEEQVSTSTSSSPLTKILIGIIAGLVVIFAIGVGAYFLTSEKGPFNLLGCSKELKICSDGTGVGRVAPLCEFAECPNTISSDTNVPADWKTYRNEGANSNFKVELSIDFNNVQIPILPIEDGETTYTGNIQGTTYTANDQNVFPKKLGDYNLRSIKIRLIPSAEGDGDGYGYLIDISYIIENTYISETSKDSMEVRLFQGVNKEFSGNYLKYQYLLTDYLQGKIDDGSTRVTNQGIIIDKPDNNAFWIVDRDYFVYAKVGAVLEYSYINEQLGLSYYDGDLELNPVYQWYSKNFPSSAESLQTFIDNAKMNK